MAITQPTWKGVFVEMVYRYEGEFVENGYWLVAASGADPTPAELDALNVEFHNWRVANLRAWQSAAMVLQFVRSTSHMALVGNAQSILTPVSNTAGVRAAQPLPGGTSVCVTLKTAKSGRRFRGRSYMTGLTADMIVSGNQVTAAAVNGFNAAYAALITQLVTNTRFRYGVRSSVNTIFAVGISPTTATVEPITDIYTDNLVDSQRRRLAGRGA